MESQGVSCNWSEILNTESVGDTVENPGKTTPHVYLLGSPWGAKIFSDSSAKGCELELNNKVNM